MDARPSAPRRILFAGLSLSGGLLAALLLAEIGLRLFAPQQTGHVQYDWNPELGQVQVPHQHARRTVPGVFSFTYTNNCLGLRGTREYPAGRRPGPGGHGFTVGPILLGAAAPAHIMTPSATVRRIVNMTALAGVEAAVAR